MAFTKSLDEVVGPVVAMLVDGTEYRQVLTARPGPDKHVTPDGRTWIAVSEEVLEGTVVSSRSTIHWKGSAIGGNPGVPLRPVVFNFQSTAFQVVKSDGLRQWEQRMREKVGLNASLTFATTMTEIDTPGD